MRFYSISDKGKVRILNEDFYYLPIHKENFCAVADGMGGHNAGEVASFMAINALVQALRNVSSDAEHAMRTALETANTTVLNHANAAEGTNGMGTTLTSLIFDGDRVVLGHIGDSRAYRFRAGKLEQLSTDHSFVEGLVQSGLITREEARVHPRRNLITRCIGIGEEIEPEIKTFELSPGDVYLLCSDGLTTMLTDTEIETVLKNRSLTLQSRLDMLVKNALTKGGEDNITLVAAFGGESDG